MPTQVQSKKIQSEESPVKHTLASEIPDTSPAKEVIQHAKNSAIVYSNEINVKYVAGGALALLGIGAGIYFSRK